MKQKSNSKIENSEASFLEDPSILSRIFEVYPDPCWIINENNVFDMCNQMAAELFGYTSPDELLNTHPSEISPEFQPDGERSLTKADRMIHEAHQKGINRFEWQHCKVDGTIFPFEITLISILKDTPDGPKKYLYCIGRDIRDKRYLENQLRRAQKMNMLESMSGSITHDFKNILAGIEGNIYLIQTKYSHEKPLLKRLDNIQRLTGNAGSIIRPVLRLSRHEANEELPSEPLEINEFFNNNDQLIRSILSDNIEYRFIQHSSRIHVFADENQLQQVLLNIFMNAKDALLHTSDGVITCSITDIELEPSAPDSKHFVRISIRDNGSGMEPEHIKKVTRPFFTTKPPGSGTGLGLAMVNEMIKTLGGYIEIQSIKGQGTTIDICLPVCEPVAHQANKDATKEKPQTENQQGNGETILIVEDNPELQNLLCEFLGSLNYHLLSATDGKSALNMIKDSSRNIDLVISDLILPQLSGAQLVEEMKSSQINKPVIFTTGYTDASSLSGAAAGIPVLRKPYKLNEVALHIASSLDKIK